MDPSKKGITAHFDNDNNIIIKKSKSGSKMEILASVNYLIQECNKKLARIQSKIEDRITIDYDSLRKDGYDGLQFGKLEFTDKYRYNELYDKIWFFLARWEPNTVVIWNWCLEDDHEIYFINTST